MRDRLRAAPAAALLCLLGVYYWQRNVIAPVHLPQPVTSWNQDLYAIYYPVYSFAYRSPHFLPRWNPHQLAGIPALAAYNGGLLYPPNFLAAVLPVHLAIGYLSAAHLALAGLLGFLCARALALSLPAAALTGAAYMLSGYFVLDAIHPSYLAADAWIPGVFLGAIHVLQRPDPRSAVLLALAVSLQLMAGGPHVLCYTAYALAAGGLVLLLLHPAARARGRVRRVALALVLAVALAVLLSAVQTFPTLELVARAARSFHGLTVEQTLPAQPSLHALAFALFMPGLAVFPALVGLADRRRPAVVAALGAVVLVAGLVGLGTPVYARVFYHLPAVKMFRLPQEILNTGTFALALLAGIGLDLLAVAPRPRVLALAALAGGMGLMSVTPPGLRIAAEVVLAAGLGLLLIPSRPARAAIAWVVVAVVIGERFAHARNGSMMPQHNDAGFFQPPPAVRFLAARAHGDRVLVIRDWKNRFPFMEKLGSLWGLDVVQDYEPLAPAPYERFLAPLDRSNVDRPLFWGRFYPPPAASGWRLLDALATRYVLVPAGVMWPGDGTDRFRLAYEGPDARVYENRASLPRARLVTDVRVIPDPEQTLEALWRDDIDLGATAIVDEPVDLGPRDVAEAGEQMEVHLDRLDDEEMLLSASVGRAALLVIADLWWPGWHVAVDGAERPLYRVDYLFRGVAVEPGRHLVRFWYRPVAFEAGAVVTATTVVMLVLIGGLRRRRRAST